MSTTTPKPPTQGQRIAALEGGMHEILSLLRGSAPQLSTPTAVAEATAPVAAPEAAPQAPEPVTASTALKEYVESKGLAFSRGGRAELNLDALTAAVRVIKTGNPELVSLVGVGKLGKRSVTHVAIGRSDDGKSIITQYVFNPTATK